MNRLYSHLTSSYVNKSQQSSECNSNSNSSSRCASSSKRLIDSGHLRCGGVGGADRPITVAHNLNIKRSVNDNNNNSIIHHDSNINNLKSCKGSRRSTIYIPDYNSRYTPRKGRNPNMNLDNDFKYVTSADIHSLPCDCNNLTVAQLLRSAGVEVTSPKDTREDSRTSSKFSFPSNSCHPVKTLSVSESQDSASVTSAVWPSSSAEYHPVVDYKLVAACIYL
jgi:hypothetical protein